ncbi:MAG TPA: hypothetical protein VGY98_14135 [Verrucomicrobiae bacterium]|nr:hypothetical protein [Verrucomicrobiae bacterium]
MPLAQGDGLEWDDPRDIHEVIVDFATPPPPGAKVHVEYWGSDWPQQYLPRDHALGSGFSGWMELGDWYNGGWRIADTKQTTSGNSILFTFEPINAREYRQLTNYSSTGRFTLKLRIAGGEPLPKILQIRALTDSTVANRTVRVVWKRPTAFNFQATAFNGRILGAKTDGRASILRIETVVSSNLNTFDRTLITLTNGADVFTFRVDDLKQGALYLPEYGAAILPESDRRDYQTVAGDVHRAGQKTLYERVAEMPEQTWHSAWNGMPPKKSRISFVLGLDGARQKFRLEPNGNVSFRISDQFIGSVPGNDTLRLALEDSPVTVEFGLPEQPVERHIEDESIPICVTTWERNGINVAQTAFATTLNGVKSKGPPPEPDACAVAMLRFDFTNTTGFPQTASLPVTILSNTNSERLNLDSKGLIWDGSLLRGELCATAQNSADLVPQVSSPVDWSIPLPAHETKSFILKVPYFPLAKPSESNALAALDFNSERRNVAKYWRLRLDQSARLITPEPELTHFYRAVAGHLLINCEIAPGSASRFARVGSFRYGVYPNESCMMILDLDRRGYHQVAEECLDTWLHYKGTAGLPGDFDSTNGILYGAAGYESGGYNQGQGWVLWTLSQHFRFTRDQKWLRRVAPHIVSGADWIIRETARTAGRPDLGNGLLPPGDLEDISDWWTWLSTSCYTWRGLDGAAWALEQIHDPNASRIRAAADGYHENLVDRFLAASALSPVVRLRNGTAVPQIPSYAQRRGRSFGWIRQTLEGPMHLIITRAIDPNSVRAKWILEDYEDNLFLSEQYGYHVDNFDKYWFGRGGMTMQACLLFDVEAYLYRDDDKQALRAMFNAIALNHFSDVHMNAEHALPEMGDWLGDVYKSSDEANVCGWLRDIFVREDGDVLLVGQAVPRDWLKPGQTCGIENTSTCFGKASIIFNANANCIIAKLQGPKRNPPREIRLRFRTPQEQPLASVKVNGREWKKWNADWIVLPGNIGRAVIVATF